MLRKIELSGGGGWYSVMPRDQDRYLLTTILSILMTLFLYFCIGLALLCIITAVDPNCMRCDE